ncbi:MAG: hypothetical protein AAFU77_11280 [Myxococcota bacterium]
MVLDVLTRANLFRPAWTELLSFEPLTWALILVVAWTRSWWATVAAAVALVGIRTFAIAEHGCRHFLKRPLDLLNDLRLVPELQELLTNTGGPNTLSFLAVALGLYVLLAIALLRGVSGHTGAVAALAGAVLVPALFLGQNMTLSGRIASELGSLTGAGSFEARVAAEHATVIERWNGADRAFRGRDLHLIVVESYGETVFRHPPYRALREERLPRFAADLAAAGFSVQSRYYRSPTFGGRSWFAHSAISAGVMVGDSDRYRMLLDSKIEPLASHFRRGGYTTTLVAPAIIRAWPESRYFSFDEVLVFESLGYEGPRFGFAMVPDQWVLDRVSARLGPGPNFVEWHLTSTHAPFTAHAPFLSAEALAAEHPYRDVEVKRFPITWPDLNNAEVGYAWAMDYEFQVLADALPRLIEDGGIAIVVGDHQPNGALTGDEATWNVPCHVIGSNLHRWEGYREGIEPRGPAAPLSQLFVDILENESVTAESRKDPGDRPER